jgi:hypothetical protein
MKSPRRVRELARACPSLGLATFGALAHMDEEGPLGLIVALSRRSRRSKESEILVFWHEMGSFADSPRGRGWRARPVRCRSRESARRSSAAGWTGRRSAPLRLSCWTSLSVVVAARVFCVSPCARLDLLDGGDAGRRAACLGWRSRSRRKADAAFQLRSVRLRGQPRRPHAVSSSDAADSPGLAGLPGPMALEALTE